MPLAKVQVVQGVCVIQQIRSGAVAEGEVSQGRKAIFLGCAVAEESGEDGHAAADYASAYFGSTVRCWRERLVSGVGMDLPENVDRETIPSRVCYGEPLGAVSDTANRARNSTVW